MGTTPSREIYLAARRGDVGSMEAAMRSGGDLNAINADKGETPLVASAKHGHRAAVEWLLNHGALDHVTAKGTTALFEAARAGNLETVGALLDRGADYMTRAPSGARAVDVAADEDKWAVLRLIEVRTSPFAGAVSILETGLFGFSASFQDRWVSVARPRPWDDPRHDRRNVILTVFTANNSTDTRRVMDRPRVTARKEAVGSPGLIEMTLYAPVARPHPSKNSDPALCNLTVRCDALTAEWLFNVLADEFASGQGPAFDMRGATAVAVKIPNAYAARAACFSTDRVNAEVALGNFKTRVFNAASVGFVVPAGLAISSPTLTPLPIAVTRTQAPQAPARDDTGNTGTYPFPQQTQNNLIVPGHQVGTPRNIYPNAYNANAYPAQGLGQGQGQGLPYHGAGATYPGQHALYPGQAGGYPAAQGQGQGVQGVYPTQNYQAQQAQAQQFYVAQQQAMPYGGGAVPFAVAVGGSQGQGQGQQQGVNGGRPHSVSPNLRDLGTAAAARGAAAAPPSPASPAYLTGALAALITLQKLNRLLPPDAPEPPAHYLCIITSEIMLDPVVSSDGSTYSRDGISAWMAQSGPGLAPKSPLTNEPLDGHLVPNTLLRGQVIEWVEGVRRASSAAEKNASLAPPPPSATLSPPPTVALTAAPLPLAATSSEAPPSASAPPSEEIIFDVAAMLADLPAATASPQVTHAAALESAENRETRLAIEAVAELEAGGAQVRMPAVA